eukprot:6213991-Amphidinium_carterae.3
MCRPAAEALSLPVQTIVAVPDLGHSQGERLLGMQCVCLHAFADTRTSGLGRNHLHASRCSSFSYHDD